MSISQVTYPREIVFNGDTIIAVTPKQFKDVINNDASFKECIQVRNEFEKQISTYETMIQGYVSIIERNDNQKENLQKQLSLKDGIIAVKDEQICTLNDLCKRRKFFIAILSGLTAALTIVAIIK